MLRAFFKHDRKLFSEVSRLIFDMVQDYLNEAAKTRVETAAGQKLEGAGKSCAVPGRSANLAQKSELRELPQKGSLPHLIQRVLRNENLKLFDTSDFIVLLTQHLPPRRVQHIRRYGLYSSRSRGKWTDKPYVAALAPDGWKQKHLDSPDSPETQEEYNPDCSVCSSESRAAWARLIARVYEVNPLKCVKCGSPMKILAVITDPEEIKKILRHLVKIGRPPPGLDPSTLN